MLPSRQSPDLLAGHWELVNRLGRVPRVLLWDNESAVGKWRAGKPELTGPMNAFRGMLGIKVVQCRPGDPEAKGLVEPAAGRPPAPPAALRPADTSTDANSLDGRAS